MNEIFLGLYSQLLGSLWTIIEIVFITCMIVIIRKFHLSGRFVALLGFIFLAFVLIASLFQQDDSAGLIAQYVWIVFAIAFITEVVNFIHNEKK